MNQIRKCPACGAERPANRFKPSTAGRSWTNKLGDAWRKCPECSHKAGTSDFRLVIDRREGQA